MTIWEMSCSGAVLIAAILLLRRLALYRLPKWTFLLLWAVALARLLVPVAVPSPVSVYSGAEALWELAQEEAIPPEPVEPVEPVSPVLVMPGGVSAVPDRGPVPTEIAPIVPAAPDRAPAGTGSPSPVDEAPGAAEIVTAVYIAGACLLAVWFLGAYWRCWRVLRRAEPVENEVLARWRMDHPRARVRFRQSGAVTAPLTYGLLHPTVLFPDKTDWTDREGLRYVLAHEYVHIRRRDVWWKLLLAVAVCVHWFDPMVWCMYVYANRDLELSCDEAVVRAFGLPARPGYALTLLHAEAQRQLPLCSSYSGQAAIKERITAIMKSRKLTAAAVLAALVLVCTMAAVFAGTPAKGMPGTDRLVETLGSVQPPEGPRHQRTSAVFDLFSKGISITLIRPYDENANYGLVDSGVLPDGTEYWVFFLTPAETIQHGGKLRCWHGKAKVPIGDTEAVGRVLGDTLHVGNGTYIAVDVDGLPSTMATVDVGYFPAGAENCTVNISSFSTVIFKPANPSSEMTVKVSTHESKSVTANFRVYTTSERPVPDDLPEALPSQPETPPVPAAAVPDVVPAEPESKYPVNSLGHTYGRWTEADGYEDVPDLIWYQIDRETTGYLKRERLYPYSYPLQTEEEIEAYLEWCGGENGDWEGRSLDFGLAVQVYELDETTVVGYATFVWDNCCIDSKEALLDRLAQGDPVRLLPCAGTAPVENRPHREDTLHPDSKLWCASARDLTPWEAGLLEKYVGEDGDWHRNSRGETYGAKDLAGYVGYYPDLVGCKNSCLGEPDISWYYITYEDMMERRENPRTPGTYPVYNAEHELIGHEVITDGPPSRINRIFPLDMED